MPCESLVLSYIWFLHFSAKTLVDCSFSNQIISDPVIIIKLQRTSDK